MPREQPTTEVTVKILRESSRAILVTDDDLRSVWLPKSQITYDTRGKITTVTLPEWLAQDKGLA